jgi:DNA-binding NtrC family response regulator
VRPPREEAVTALRRDEAERLGLCQAGIPKDWRLPEKPGKIIYAHECASASEREGLKLPDWLGLDEPPQADPREHHLRVLQELLGRDYLIRADWEYALRDLAQMAREATRAAEGFVALFDPERAVWSAVTSTGQRLEEEAISLRGSRSVLDQVRTQSKPILSTGIAPLELSSESLRLHDVESVLAVPLLWWDVTEAEPRSQMGACLYVHRTSAEGAFTDAEAELLVDIARIAQPALNLLRHLQGVKADLEASRERLAEIQKAAAKEYGLGPYRTHERWFARTVLEPLRRMARANKVGLLITGPTGSGKSHLAQAIHLEGPRKSGPFLMLDCSQVTSDESLAAELFGYSARSGFANAPERGRSGMAALAHRGTLFIEEIGVLPPTLQQRLLTLIEMGVYSPLGSSERLQVDLQVIAATNEDLPRLVREGRFREDLFWRIGEVTVQLPSLSEREADIPALAETFLGSACRRFGRRNLEGFTPQAMEVLIRHDWAQGGNIRGLQQTIHRSVLLLAPEAQRLDAPDLRFTEPLGRGRAPAAERQAEKPSVPTPDLEAILEAIRKHGSGTAAARSLGISRGVLVWQLRKAGLTIGEAF